ncbi:hypothetical protein PVAP13_1NG172900 [Panicum virgatum]|uniref:Uncharacterized protein n=1 Tax=Panicum virgatum TaxID=38727 RepID=A0A8T0X3V7_PANVG|nr:hypothetical protein PVAP13_1NG172900 [Panicum virgatum]
MGNPRRAATMLRRPPLASSTPLSFGYRRAKADRPVAFSSVLLPSPRLLSRRARLHWRPGQTIGGGRRTRRPAGGRSGATPGAGEPAARAAFRPPPRSLPQRYGACLSYRLPIPQS